MTLEEIVTALKSPGAPSADALRAGVDKASELAPAIFTLADKVCEGTYLLPEDGRLLSYGLTILAAAKQGELFPYLLKLARLEEDELERLFSLRAQTSLARLLLSVWDGDSDAVFAAIEDAGLTSEVRLAWFDVLARLTFDGAIPREKTLAFLARLERDGAFPDDDMVWWGWEGAVLRLGARDLEPALKRVWSKDIFGPHREEDEAESLEILQRAEADPGNAAIFDEDEVCAIGDPAEAYDWMARRDKALEDWAAEAEEDQEPDDDPAKAIRLTGEEVEWLSGFLVSQQTPETTMPFEMFDGFLTALVIGPEMVMPSVYLPEIWGTEDGSGPVWDSQAQLQYFMDLTGKHWNAIAERRNADAPHEPEIGYAGSEEIGRTWAEGFVMGVHLAGDAWDRLMRDEAVGPVAVQILALAVGDDELPAEDRAEIVEELPEIVRAIAAYWRDAPAFLDRQMPDRVQKIGRNEPCPCGSGKKYKKCCGMNGSQVLH
jgi:uncharacterized protein